MKSRVNELTDCKAIRHESINEVDNDDCFHFDSSIDNDFLSSASLDNAYDRSVIIDGI